MRAQPTHAQRRREALISTVAALLDQGEPTRFAYEGAARAGLRSGWCLQSWPWEIADAVAAEVVNEAFKRLGVGRPSWIEGQPEHVEAVVERLACVACGAEIGESRHRNGEERKFCSDPCRVAFHSRMRRRDEERATRAEYLAAQAARKDATRPMRDCQWCGTPYRPNAGTRPGKYCSRTCANRATNAKRFGKG